MAEFGPDLQNALIFQGFSDDELAYLSRQITSRPFKAGDNLLESGRDAPGIFVIGAGVVNAVVTDESGHEREVATLGKGECVGEIALMTGEPCSATVKAVTDGEAQLLERDDFLELVERYPGLWRNLGRILSQRLVRTSRHLSHQSLANTVALLTDCPEDACASLSVAVARSMATQTGKRVLLVDARAQSTCPIAALSADELAPTFADVLRDRSLVAELQAFAHGNGASAVRITSIARAEQPRPSEEECAAALRLLAPLHDSVYSARAAGRNRAPFSA